MVAAGWNVGQIRAVLKGDNGTIGAEVAAEQARQGIAPVSAAPRVIPHRANGVVRDLAMDDAL
jgi:hypothetical protein